VTEKFEFIDAEYAAYRESDDEYVPLAPGTQVIGRDRACTISPAAAGTSSTSATFRNNHEPGKPRSSLIAWPAKKGTGFGGDPEDPWA
jgi:hypothetical protein